MFKHGKYDLSTGGSYSIQEDRQKYRQNSIFKMSRKSNKSSKKSGQIPTYPHGENVINQPQTLGADPLDDSSSSFYFVGVIFIFSIIFSWLGFFFHVVNVS